MLKCDPKMLAKSYTIKNYEPGFEKRQVEIFNTLIHSLNPKSKLITTEKVLKRHTDKNFHPEQVKYLLNDKNEIIGYTEIRISGDMHLIFYPLILKEYSSPELVDLLFKEIYNYSLSLKPNLIQAVYNFNFSQAHTYFEKQKVAKLRDKYVRPEIAITIDKLDKISTNYEIQSLEPKHFQPLVEFLNSTDSPLNRMTIERLQNNYEKGIINSRNSFIIYKANVLSAFVIFFRFESEGEIKESYGYIQDAISPRLSDDLEIRKALVIAGSTFLRSNSLTSLVLFVFNPSKSYFLYKQIGFEENSYGRNMYCFETNNNSHEVPWHND